MTAVDDDSTKAIAVRTAKTPKQTLLIVMKAGLAKAMLLWWQIVLLGWHAGLFIGLAAGLTVVVNGGLASSTISGSIPVYDGTSTDAVSYSTIELQVGVPVGLKKLIAGSLFPLGLMMVVLSGAELYTGNVLFVTAALMGRKITFNQLLKNWTCAYCGNLCGALACAYFLFHQAEFISGSTQVYLNDLATAKTQQDMWAAYFLRGMGCNFLVCLALWGASSADNALSKIVAIWWPMMAISATGFEQSVSNMFFIPLAMMGGHSLTTGQFISRNLIPVSLGNILGGLFFITVQYLIYHPYITIDVQHMTLHQGGAHRPFSSEAVLKDESEKSNGDYSAVDSARPLSLLRPSRVNSHLGDTDKPSRVNSHYGDGDQSHHSQSYHSHYGEHEVPTAENTIFGPVTIPLLLDRLGEALGVCTAGILEGTHEDEQELSSDEGGIEMTQDSSLPSGDMKDLEENAVMNEIVVMDIADINNDNSSANNSAHNSIRSSPHTSVHKSNQNSPY